jgi:hypothetical protein
VSHWACHAPITNGTPTIETSTPMSPSAAVVIGFGEWAPHKSHTLSRRGDIPLWSPLFRSDFLLKLCLTFLSWLPTHIPTRKMSNVHHAIGVHGHLSPERRSENVVQMHLDWDRNLVRSCWLLSQL